MLYDQKKPKNVSHCLHNRNTYRNASIIACKEVARKGIKNLISRYY